MPHRSNTTSALSIVRHTITEIQQFSNICSKNQVYLLVLPIAKSAQDTLQRLEKISLLMQNMLAQIGQAATLLVICDTLDAIAVHSEASKSLHYQMWIALKREKSISSDANSALPNAHVAMLVYTGYQKALQHTKTRIEYSYCPTCQKTTKDYGGKKHTYDAFGTLISDVWRDISCTLGNDFTPIIERCADIFAIELYSTLHVIDCQAIGFKRFPLYPTLQRTARHNTSHLTLPLNSIMQGDCLEKLAVIPDNSIDFIFIDPPYNLKKTYGNYGDDLEISDYFAWCDSWLSELARVLKPGRTLALLNIPLWCIRHFLHVEKILEYQNWIVWDALSYPVRQIMPAHYGIICFTKGTPRSLPMFDNIAQPQPFEYPSQALSSLRQLKEGFCVRPVCIEQRRRSNIEDRELLTDIWSDIHRLKHNSRRVDHPTQLPPTLLYRLIQTFTYPNEVVLDCFNGAGTTSLCAQQLQRKYIGIELSPQYAQLSQDRHKEIEQGIEPFRKEERTLTAKNSVVPRLKKQKYQVPKKTLQLEVKRIAELLGHLPNRSEVESQSAYPINLYDEYFSSWGEVCAAARNTGMTESRILRFLPEQEERMLSLFDDHSHL